MISTRLERLTAAIEAVAPLHGCAILPPSTTGPPGWHLVTNVSTGEEVRIDYHVSATPEQIAAGDEIARTFDLTEGVRVPRLLWDILQDYNALSGSQRSKVWADLTKGDPPLWATDAGPNAAAVFSLHWATAQGGSPTAIDVAKSYLVSAYVQDNPTYLVGPPFDPTINLPGDQPATEEE